MKQNIEIKAIVNNTTQLEQNILEYSSGLKEILEQTDTFFNTNNGRLKLREFSNQEAQLIYYKRQNQEGPKSSSYAIHQVSDAAGLKECLNLSYGIKGIIKKTRRLYFNDQTRIHLDKVEGLGDFIELEVVLEANQTFDFGESIAQELMQKLKIKPDQLIDCAYIDLLQNNLFNNEKRAANAAL
ncbi:hypothetical protein BVY03_03040 [bacterium K02(2017)]|nr:hypothetical protein BVY03_03040 [bacterium K02(2017)]